MLQYVGQYCDIIAIHRIEFFDEARMYFETYFACYRSGHLVQFEPFHLETIPSIESKPATLIAADIQKLARATPLVEGDIAIEPYPSAIEERKQKSFPPTRVTCARLSTKVVVSLVERLELGCGWCGICLFQATMNTTPNFIRPR